MRISGGRIRNGRFERVEPRCHICREEYLRRRVNELLDWHGVPVAWGRGQVKALTYSDILKDVNEGRAEADLITLASLRVHRKSHYDLDGVVAHWAAQMDKMLRSALGGR
jgi:hypothetical protein